MIDIQKMKQAALAVAPNESSDVFGRMTAHAEFLKVANPSAVLELIERLETLGNQVVKQAARIKELEERESVSLVVTQMKKIAAQAAVIEKLRGALFDINTSGGLDECGSGFSPRWVAKHALSTQTDSKQILQEWLDEKLGEPVSYVEEGIFLATPFSRKRINFESPYSVQTPLFKKPELLK